MVAGWQDAIGRRKAKRVCVEGHTPQDELRRERPSRAGSSPASVMSGETAIASNKKKGDNYEKAKVDTDTQR